MVKSFVALFLLQGTPDVMSSKGSGATSSQPAVEDSEKVDFCKNLALKMIYLDFHGTCQLIKPFSSSPDLLQMMTDSKQMQSAVSDSSQTSPMLSSPNKVLKVI